MPPATPSSSPGRALSSAISVDDFPTPPRLTSGTASEVIDVDEVGAGYTPPRQRSRFVDGLRSAAMEVDEDSEGDSRAASEDSAPASDDAEDEDRFIRLAAYARLFPHVLAAPGHRRTAARGAAIRARFVNAIHVAADEAQAEATEEALQLAREDRAARAQEARAARAQEARDIATVLEERRLLGLDVFVPWKETNAYLTADRPPEVPLHEAVDPDLACAICADVLSHPVMTSCHHIFCFICLRSNMEVSLRCPVCRQVQTVAPTSLPPFNRLLEYAVKKCYPGWQDNSKVKVEFVNLQALNGRNLV